MIEFNGYLTGKAEKHFQRKARVLGQKILLISTVVLLPFCIAWTIRIQNPILLYICCTTFVIAPLLLYIPKRKKERLSLTPKCICVEDECIICIADKYTEQRFISNVKNVYDYGEYYELIFPFGKVSEKFICQKDLLTHGSIEEFESIFREKIIRK